MKLGIKILLSAILLLLTLIGGVYWGAKMDMFKTYEEEKSEVMLEKISKVFKLVAVEGYVSEIYDYKQYKYWDITFLRKKALVRVKAKVSIGYDFEKVEFRVNDNEHTIEILNFPEPEILSIDHDLDYFDMDEGLFNSFDEKELTELNARAKEYALTMIEKGELFEHAKEQKNEIVQMLESLFGSTGWKLVTKDKKRFIKG